VSVLSVAQYKIVVFGGGGGVKFVEGLQMNCEGEKNGCYVFVNESIANLTLFP